MSNAVRRNPFKPSSNLRQLNAVIAQADRTPRLGSLTSPCLVVHGRGDRMVPLAHGEATARAIGENARMIVVEGMGFGTLTAPAVGGLAEPSADLLRSLRKETLAATVRLLAFDRTNSAPGVDV